MEGKFFIYARKSTRSEDRQVRSIDDQLAELRELAARERLNVVCELFESQSAKVPGRPVFNAMLDRIQRGEANGILAWHPDRLARNWVDAGRVIHLVDAGIITQLKFPNVPFDSTASGKFLLGIMFGQSKHYSDNLSENIRRGQRRRAREGNWPTVPPVGYITEPRTKTVVPDPDRARHVRRAFDLYATGTYTIERLTETMNARGLTNRDGQPLSRPQYHRLLRNPIYCGIIDYAGETHEGRHKPLVTTTLFDECQRVMTRRSKPKAPRLKPYLYRGVFRCGECGYTITTEHHKGRNYLRCSKRVKRDCSQPSVHEDNIAEQIRDFLTRISISENVAEELMSRFQQLRDEEFTHTSSQITSVKEKLMDVDSRVDRLLSLYLENGISLSDFQQRKSALVYEKQVIKERLRAVERSGPTGWFEPATRFISRLRLAADLAANASDKENLDFFRKIGSNFWITNRRLTVDPRGAWKTVVAQDGTGVGSVGAVASGASRAPGFVSSAFRRTGGDETRTVDPLRALVTFFKDNPTWE